MMMSNNDTLPVAGNYATIMSYSDRDVVLVREVSEDGRTATLEALNTTADLPAGMTSLPMGHQSWKHEPTGHTYQIVWRNGAWRRKSTEYEFTEEFRKTIPTDCIGIWLRKNNPELADQIYDDHFMPCKLIPGITKAKHSYPKVRILFNVNDYHYDWEF